jgi:succinate dehydrogenase / fumarate reductase membrane anchor subunit
VLHGKKHWLYQRFSAVLLLPLIFWLIYSLSVVPDISYENMVLWLGKTINFILLSTLIIIAASHFQLGIQVILEDYVSDKNSRNSYLSILNATYYLLSFIGLVSIAKIYFGVQI